MKTNIVTAIILCSASLCHTAESQIAWGEPVNGISVGIIFSNATFRAHEPVEATVLVRNDSSEVLFLPTYPPTWYFDIMATSPTGLRFPRLPTVGSTTGARAQLQPGAMKAFNLNLQDFVAITNAEQLVITAIRHFKDGTGEHSAKSGSVGITVSSAESAPPTSKSVQEGIPANGANGEQAARTRMVAKSPASSSSPGNNSSSLANRTPDASAKRAGLGASLLVLLLAVFWRAARRKA